MNSKYIYIVSRLTGLIVRPGILFLLNKFEYTEPAYEVALYFFLTAATLVALNSELHRNYYNSAFNINSEFRKIKNYHFYIKYKIVHILIFSLFVYVFLFNYLSDPVISFFFIAIIIFEKVWDEGQRFYIFSRSYGYWSFWYLLKSMILILAVAVAIYSGSSFVSVLTILMLIYIILFLTFFKKLNLIKDFLKIIIIEKGYLKIFVKYFRMYPMIILPAQLGALASANILQVDKWFLAPIIEKKYFVEIVVACQFGAVFLIAVDNFFLAVNRNKYVNLRSKIKDVINFGHLFLLFIISIFLMMLFSEMLLKYLGVTYLTLDLFFMILSVYFIYGVTIPFVEYVFWRYPRYYSAGFDLFVLGGCTLISNLLIYNNVVYSFYYILVCFIFTRFIFYLILGLIYKYK